MTSRQRVFAALERRVPDRVPVLELSIDWKVIRGLGFRNFHAMIEGLDLDAVPVNQIRYLLGPNPWKMRLIRSWRDEWGVLRRLTGEILPYPDPAGSPIRSPGDLRRYRPPDPAKDPVLPAVREAVRRYQGKRAILMLGRDAFAGAWNLCGMETLLVSYLADADFAKALTRMTVDYFTELHRLAIREGAEVIVLGDDYAHKCGPLMSPSHFREFVLPGLREIVRGIRRAGAYCIKHTDGNIEELIEAIIDTGVDGIGPLEPGAGMKLGALKRRFGRRVCLLGNVDVDLLCRGSAEEIRSRTRRLIDEVGPGGGYILSSGNSITSSVKPENFRAMVEAARRWGVYPLVGG